MFEMTDQKSAEEVPGFAEGFQAGALARDVGIEAKTFAGRECVDGQDIPDIERNDVGDEDVNVVGGVHALALTVDAVDGLDIVSAGAEGLGAFELHAPEAATGVENEVVAFGVSPGLGDAEGETSGLEDEGGFGKFSAALGVEVVTRVACGCG